jgi:hypothetical protein
LTGGLKGWNLGKILLFHHPLLPGIQRRMEIGQESQRIIRGKNRDSQKITERKQKNKIQPGQLLLPDRLLNLKSACPKEEITNIPQDAVKPTVHLLLLGCAFGESFPPVAADRYFYYTLNPPPPSNSPGQDADNLK